MAPQGTSMGITLMRNARNKCSWETVGEEKAARELKTVILDSDIASGGGQKRKGKLDFLTESLKNFR